ncbi:leukocyte surface antigen CD53-like [Maniola hyperantus]|uniref:leukocyte surface antigen CD53-like n=1 Tax=Aphantopus hyperantus TaxID=2795564 RepID=UPI001568745E|nr:tetraspanin-9-like [Maniola hyperantus]
MTLKKAELNLKSMRTLMLMITTKFMILACFMIVLGLAVYSYYHSFSFFQEGVKSGRFFTPALITFLLGVFLLIVTLFGFFGTLKQSTCLVNLYALILGLMVLLKVVVVILAFSLDPWRLREALYIPISQYVSDQEIEMEINQLQVSLDCCGSESFFDYVGMEFTGNHDTTVALASYQGGVVEVVIPATCCSKQKEGVCITLRPRGCKTALIDTFMHHSGVIGILGLCVTIMKVLGIVFALLLARCIRKAKSERGLMSWTITEQSIVARQDEIANQVGDQSGSENQAGNLAGNHHQPPPWAVTNGDASGEVPTATHIVVP